LKVEAWLNERGRGFFINSQILKSTPLAFLSLIFKSSNFQILKSTRISIIFYLYPSKSFLANNE